MKDWILNADRNYRYMYLRQLTQDYEYYIRVKKSRPWMVGEEEIRKLITSMKLLWDTFYENEKPKWLTWEMILEYEKELLK